MLSCCLLNPWGLLERRKQDSEPFRYITQALNTFTSLRSCTIIHHHLAIRNNRRNYKFPSPKSFWEKKKTIIFSNSLIILPIIFALKTLVDSHKHVPSLISQAQGTKLCVFA